MSSENYEANGYECDSNLLLISHELYFISYKNWVHREKYPNYTRLPYRKAQFYYSYTVEHVYIDTLGTGNIYRFRGVIS